MRTVVVTGGSAGIGLAIAERFAKAGWQVAVLARDGARLAEACARIETHGARVLGVPADVSDVGQVDAAAARVVAELGGIDVWVNNAMSTVVARAHEITPDEYVRVTATTYLSQVYGTLAALRHMRERNRGAIVQVSSGLAIRAAPLQAAYCGAKAAVGGFTDALRSELIADGSAVTLSVVYLPGVNTPQPTWSRNRTGHEQVIPDPLFDPRLCAEAVYSAARDPQREIWVGRSTVMMALGQAVAPAYADRKASQMIDQQQGAAIPYREGNLDVAPPGSARIDGDDGSRTIGGRYEFVTSRQVDLVKLGAVGGFLLAGSCLSLGPVARIAEVAAVNALLDRLWPTSSAPGTAARHEGYLALEDYGALGDGRSIALSGADGSIDWWCVPDIDSPPLFDRLLDADRGGRFVLQPDEPFTVERLYRAASNVLETTFSTPGGKAVLTESMNSGTAGRLPWAELARRVEGLEGAVTFTLEMRLGRRGDTVNPYHSTIGGHTVFHVEHVLGLLLHSAGIRCDWTDEVVSGTFTVEAGRRETVAIVAGSDEPLVVPTIASIDGRIDVSDDEWLTWSGGLRYDGPGREGFLRSALVLKLLLYSPSGAIAAAATTSVPERVGGSKNYDYRYAWVRDAGYTIKAFLAAGAEAEAKAAFSWLLGRLMEHGTRVCYTLDGRAVPNVSEWVVPGYRGSTPVVTGNAATDQVQHGVYGDIFETAARFVDSGNILDATSSRVLSGLADECADRWRTPDAGIWELEDERHYTMSKISCWQALARAVELADQGQLPTTCRERWARERDRIKDWIEGNCWSEEEKAFVMYPGSSKLDASLALAVRFGFDGRERLKMTLDAIDRELGSGAFHFRYTGADAEEGCFVACSFWMVEARAMLGELPEARRRLDELSGALAGGVGVLTEMVDPKRGTFLGNLPQGLSHLAHIMALSVLHEEEVRSASRLKQGN